MKEKTIYKRIFKESKDPFAGNFENTFIGKNIDKVSKELSKYDLDEFNISPVINRQENIIGFAYDEDTEFRGEDLNDLGLREILNFFVYEV